MKSAVKPNALLRAAMLGFFSFFLVAASATKYYVRTDGNNNNNGLSNTPTGAWKSVNDALYGYCNWGVLGQMVKVYRCCRVIRFLSMMGCLWRMVMVMD